ncbi:MAG: ethanolamine ammonia-lyase subunit EutB [Gemmatimonadaceae bacterium]|nr:ethanolamine ammonia-lyase subunit EutB [Gemmatimonadaceae bacterium]
MREALTYEDVFSYLQRTGGLTRVRLAQLLGAANEFKEGDAAIGVAAPDDATRTMARALFRATRVGDFHAAVLLETPLFDDDLGRLLLGSLDTVGMELIAADTFGDWVTLLLHGDPHTNRALTKHLSSEAIACLVKLMSNDELTRVSARISNALPGSSIGAPGFLGARLQPNSPTDHPDDIRWQVFSGWSYGVGDVLLGTNPVSSDPASVALVEHTLQDVIRTFELESVLPHCVLAHIDVQAEVERTSPGSTALWFQSIAGSDAANRTFDISVDSMVAHAATRTGPFAFYFETGQGADFTNGHGHRVDMVVHEARKYGFARALTASVDAARRAANPDRPWEVTQPWVIVNDVAGFIGPEVFRTREQLVRCCLEDLVMGKLHGLTIGLDVCATLHMDISLDDLDWCLDQLQPAQPAYLMALPTKVDPMLGYLTTGFQDHVRLRARSGGSVNPPMQRFFESLGAMDCDGSPGPHFGDPLHVFVLYQQRCGDTRAEHIIRADGARQMAEVRERGVFLAEGHGTNAWDLAPDLERQIRSITDDARLALWATLSTEFVRTIPDAILLETQSQSREDYILHPTTGEALSARTHDVVASLREKRGTGLNLQIVVSDGLNALAVSAAGHLLPLIDMLRAELSGTAWKAADDVLVVRSGRVRAGYRIGEVLFAGREEIGAIVHILGERPGTGHDTMSVYVTVAAGSRWSTTGAVDHDITRVVSGIAETATPPQDAARQVVRLLRNRAPAAQSDRVTTVESGRLLRGD